MSFELIPNPEQVSARREKMAADIGLFKSHVLEKFPAADQLKIGEALEFMLKIHLPQKDRVDGRPFASHPLAVAEKTMSFSDNPELIMAALIHDSVEDQPEYIFMERINRKHQGLSSLHFDINETVKEKYRSIFTAWSFKEINDRFGAKIKYYTENMTNHDFNSLAENLGLVGEEKQNFVNKLYAEHVEDIINDPELFTLKLSDLSTNIDLHSLNPESEKYQKLRRKYKSVIEAILEKLNNLPENHPLYDNREAVITSLNQIYLEQYAN